VCGEISLGGECFTYRGMSAPVLRVVIDQLLAELEPWCAGVGVRGGERVGVGGAAGGGEGGGGDGEGGEGHAGAGGGLQGGVLGDGGLAGGLRGGKWEGGRERTARRERGRWGKRGGRHT